MPNHLYAARYVDTSIGGSSPNENFSDIADLGFRWTAQGGIQRVELTVRNKNRLDGYRRYDEHLGDTIAIYDDYLHNYISGQVYEIIPDGRHCTYICSGPFKRTNDDVYETGDMGDLGVLSGTDVAVIDILDDSVTVDDSDQTNIDSSNVVVSGWTARPEGTPAGDALKELAAIGDNSNNPMDFYFVDQEFYRTQMQAPIPYFKSRSTTASPDWIFSIEDLAPNGLTLARHIWNLKTHIQIGYGRLAGLHDGGNGSNTLIDGGEDFITDGVRPGDRVINITDDAVYEVAAVTNLTTLTFTDNAGGAWDNGDWYSIKMREPKWTADPGTTTSDYWSVVHREKRMEMSQAQAEEYRDQLYALYNAAQLQQAFVISAPTIQDGNGVRHALWEPFFGTSFYFRADNLFIDEAVFNDSDDRANSFMVIAMDYSYARNRLRLVPSTSDSRLDAILGQAGIVDGQIISTETAWRNRKRAEN